MDIEKLSESFALISDEFGVKLNAAQIVLIEHSLKLLQHENKLRKMYFWGRIDGIESDYFIAFGHNQNGLYQYFYSINCTDWFILILQTLNELERASKCCKDDFVGRPKHTIGVSLFDEGDKSVVIDLMEVKRLAYLIYNICKEINAIQAEDADNQCLELSNDLPLFNRNKYKEVKNVLATSNIESVLQQYHSIKSTQWPGLVFYHQFSSNCSGYAYFGNGQKNLDVLFMMKIKS